ncbi:MAG: hypothetical protein KJ587_09545 [Alphaproteobacteria bacterium]|nr:hypothetical protein [Alphaproteobacteria bacterium]
MTTGSLFGGSSQTAAPVAPVDNNTPTGRALHVGTVAARASKCGYNFDAAGLKSNYLAAEAASGLAVGDLTRVEQIYDTGYRGVMTAAASEPDYCNSKRTAAIKTDLTKVLSADFSPPPAPKVAGDGGVFGGLFDQDVVADKGPQFGTGDWWDSQRDNKR